MDGRHAPTMTGGHVAFGPRQPRSGRAAAFEKMHDQRNHGEDQQDVNQKAGDVQDEKAQQPAHHQYYSNHRQHFRSPLPEIVTTTEAASSSEIFAASA
jgi:hypothetical protein